LIVSGLVCQWLLGELRLLPEWCKGDMAKEWIQKIADEIKHKEHGPAEQAAKAQRHQHILTTKGKIFFEELIASLREDIDELKAALKGDITDAPTSIQGSMLTNLTITRTQFPQVQANISYAHDRITLGQQLQSGQNRAISYSFHVGEGEGISVREMFGENVKHFNHPNELAKHIMELLFSVSVKPLAG
jgi:hypothetical protein